MKNVAINVNINNYNASPFDTINSIKKAGFTNIFINWKNYVGKDGTIITGEEQFMYAKNKGLNVIFVHLLCPRMFEVWDENTTLEFDKKFEVFKKDIDDCQRCGIHLAVMHINGGWETESHITDVGLNRLQDMIYYANNKGITIAMENANSLPGGYLESAITNLTCKNFGICYDSGHANCNPYGTKMNFSLFKDKILAVHLHDNHGKFENGPNGEDRDEHLFPFEGNVDWNNILKNLKNCNYQGPVTLELHYDKPYLNMTIDEFYAKAYELAKKLEDMSDKT